MVLHATPGGDHMKTGKPARLGNNQFFEFPSTGRNNLALEIRAGRCRVKRRGILSIISAAVLLLPVMAATSSMALAQDRDRDRDQLKAREQLQDKDKLRTKDQLKEKEQLKEEERTREQARKDRPERSQHEKAGRSVRHGR